MSSRRTATDICLLAPVPRFEQLLVNGRSVCSGGAEVQMAAIGQGLAERGLRVSYLVYQSQGPRVRMVNGGITLVGCYRPRGKAHGLHYLSETLPGMLTGLRLADAAVYYARGASGLAGLAASYAWARGRGFVFAVSSDRDVSRAGLRSLLKPHDRVLFGAAVHRADAIVVQTDEQRAWLRQQFHRDGLLMPSMCDRFPAEAELGGGHAILWAGRARHVKRPLMFLELARRCPDLRFAMALSDSATDRALHDRVMSEARALGNLQVLVDVPYCNMSQHFDQAALLVNTSECEGFPNTFLEAWAVGRPVVATVDPDGLLSRGGLGIYAQDADGLARAVSELMASPERRREMGARGREWVRARHSREAVLDAYVEMIARTARQHRLRIGECGLRNGKAKSEE